MAKKAVWQRTKRDAKELNRIARPGDTFYVIRDIAPRYTKYYSSPQFVVAHTVDFMHPLFFGGMISGSLSVTSMLLSEGPVYSYHPRTPGGNEIPLLGEKLPPAHGPLGADIHREFNDYEISQMEKQVEANKADRKKEKSSWW